MRSLLLFCLFYFISVVRLQDPCTFRSDTFYSYQSVIECFQTVPFNETVRQHTLQVLEKAMQLYAFLDIATNPPDPNFFYPPVDLLGSFEQMLIRNYSNDFNFHMDLRWLFLQLHDAHTNYYAPACYSSFDFYQPFSVVSYVTSDKRQILAISRYFQPEVKKYFESMGENLDELVGGEILTILGKPALDIMKVYTDKYVGLVKDPATRFNIALGIPTPFQNIYPTHWLGIFSDRKPHYGPPPGELWIDYDIRLLNGSIINKNYTWVSRTNVPYSDSESFMKACVYSAPEPEHIPNKETLSNDAVIKPPFVPIANATSSGIGFYQIDNRTLVWYMNNFEPSDYYAFESTVNTGFFYASYHGLDRLIIDLTGNGGGDICLGRSMLKFLFPKGVNYGPTDMPVSPLAINLTKTAILNNINETEWSPAFYQNQHGISWRNDDISWLVPGLIHQRGGLSRNYSQLIHIGNNVDDCGDYPFVNTKPFDANKILIITRGFCGSTCALFADHANQYAHVRTLVVGGFTGQSQQYTSFPGLEVLETPSFYDLLDELKQNTADQTCPDCWLSPRRLLTSGGYRMCIREIYPPDSTHAPLEYTFLKSDYHLDLNKDTVDQPEYTWLEALQFFEDGDW